MQGFGLRTTGHPDALSSATVSTDSKAVSGKAKKRAYTNANGVQRRLRSLFLEVGQVSGEGWKQN